MIPKLKIPVTQPGHTPKKEKTTDKGQWEVTPRNSGTPRKMGPLSNGPKSSTEEKNQSTQTKWTLTPRNMGTDQYKNDIRPTGLVKVLPSTPRSPTKPGHRDSMIGKKKKKTPTEPQTPRDLTNTQGQEEPQTPRLTRKDGKPNLRYFNGVTPPSDLPNAPARPEQPLPFNGISPPPQGLPPELPTSDEPSTNHPNTLTNSFIKTIDDVMDLREKGVAPKDLIDLLKPSRPAPAPPRPETDAQLLPENTKRYNGVAPPSDLPSPPSPQGNKPANEGGALPTPPQHD